MVEDNSEKACSRKYQTTRKDYNSNVYDLYGDYDNIPSNNRLPETDDISKIINRTLPATKKGFFKLKTDKIDPLNNINIIPDYKLYIEQLQYNILPSNLINTTNGTLNDNGHLINLSGGTCTPRTNLIHLNKLKDGGVSRIDLYSTNVKYTIFNRKNQSVQTTYTEIDLSKIEDNYIYIILDIGANSDFTRMSCYSNQELRISKI